MERPTEDSFLNDILDLPDGHRDALLEGLVGDNPMTEDECDAFLEDLFDDDDDDE